MECPNCAFQNTPGTPSCARCAGRLDFSDVDVIPLRAPRSAAGRWLARTLGVAGFGARDVARRVGADLVRPRWMDRSWDGVSPRELFLCSIPGLAQISRGHRLLGRCLMGAWAGLLLLALLTIGSGLSILAALGAISVHCAAVTLLLGGVLETMTIRRRLLTGVIVYVFVAGLLYLPAYWGLRQVVRIVPIVAIARSGIVRAGDVLVAPGSAFGVPVPERGDIVLYHVSTITSSAVIVRGGAWIDRVLGIPGDHIAVRGGIVYLNDVPIPDDMGPLGDLNECRDIDLVAGPGQYIVLPSLVSFDMHGQEARQYRAMMFSTISTVRAEQIEAKIAYRIRPWLRAGSLRPPASVRAPEGAAP